MKRLFFSAAIFCSGISLSIIVFMIILGLPLFREGLFFKMLVTPWDPIHGSYGIFPMIFGSLAISVLALLWGFPLSLGTAALISGIAPTFVASAMKKTIQMMTGIPTVVYGFIGIFLLVPLIRNSFGHGSGMCILTASLLLAVLISPTMILVFTDSFNHVPESTVMAARALGASKVQTFLHVILPSSVNGIVSGLILALGRAMGDTMIALMVSGNAVAFPDSILSPSRTLTAHIALVIASDFKSLEFKTIFACGIVLYGFTMLITALIRSFLIFDRRTP